MLLYTPCKTRNTLCIRKITKEICNIMLQIKSRTWNNRSLFQKNKSLKNDRILVVPASEIVSILLIYQILEIAEKEKSS